MLREYRILLPNINFEKFTGKLYIGSFLYDNDDMEEVKKQAIELLPELDAKVFEVEPGTRFSEEDSKVFECKNSYVVIEYFPYDLDFEIGDLVDMALFHKRYTLLNTTNLKAEDFESWGEMKRYIEKTEKPFVIYPVSMRDHGDLYLTLGFLNDFDSGVIGYIYITKEKAQKNNLSYEEAKIIINGIIKEYEAYLNSEIYNVFELSKDLYFEEPVIYDSCLVFGYSNVEDYLKENYNLELLD